MKLSQLGYTMTELVVVLAILGILAGFSIPAVNQWREVASRREVASDVARLMMQARARAIARNETVMLDFAIDGGATNANNSCTISSPTINETKSLALGIEIRGKKDCTLTSGNMSIRFNPDGTIWTDTGSAICVYSGSTVRFSAGIPFTATGRVVTARGMLP